MERRDVLRVNYVKQFVQLKQSRSSLRKEMMEAEKQPNTILICLNVFTVDFAKNLAQLTQAMKTSEQSIRFLNLAHNPLSFQYAVTSEA